MNNAETPDVDVSEIIEYAGVTRIKAIKNKKERED
mgnify:FL=1